MNRRIHIFILAACAFLSFFPNVSASNIPPYSRKDWGRWLDIDHDCQDTRAELLIARSSVPAELKNGCSVSNGSWLDAYTGRLYTRAEYLDIDHVVPLKYAHDSGGALWPLEKKLRFANDPDNLMVVGSSINRAKGSKGPSMWRPPQKSAWCSYRTKWLSIGEAYGLTYSLSDRSVLLGMGVFCLMNGGV